MNKTFYYLIILIVLISPALYLLVKLPMYYSHDSSYHIARIAEFDASLKNGQFPPRLAPNILSQIGYPLFVVNYQLPYYLAEIPMYITRNAEFSFKIILAVTYIFSSIIMFTVFKKFSTNIASLTGTVVYSYLPYRFTNIYTRGSLGESVAICFVPVVLYAFFLIQKKSKLATPTLALATFGIITSHTVVFLVFLPFFILYPIILLQFKKQQIIYSVLGSALGLIMSSFQLIPSIFERKYMVFDQALTTIYKAHFINMYQLFRIPIHGVNIGTSTQLGITSTVISILSMIFLFKKRDKKIIFFLAFFLASIFLISKYSEPLWNNFFLLKYILYPWRFLSLALIAVSFLTVILIESFKFKKILAALIIIIEIFTSRHYFLSPSQTKPTILNANLTTENEYNTIWSSSQTFKDRPIVTSEEKIDIQIANNNPFNLQFKATNDQNTTITIRKLYFPGWQLKIDNKLEPININHGLISFNLKPGSWQIQTYFKETPLGVISNFLTALSSIIVFGLILKALKFNI